MGSSDKIDLPFLHSRRWFAPMTDVLRALLLSGAATLGIDESKNA
jgi:hypothetical protein